MAQACHVRQEAWQALLAGALVAEAPCMLKQVRFCVLVHVCVVTGQACQTSSEGWLAQVGWPQSA